jgi:pimeloyl-ACP methyl ester carboxylesterase
MFVPIGGIEQWITIHGADQSNPAILFLHAGPGSPISPYAEAMLAGWEQDFTLVQWDQRGAGRTFGRNPSRAPMSIERMVEDGLEVAEFITRRLKQPKVIIVAASWGTILGVHMVQRRPDLFYAYIGQSQVVRLQDPERDLIGHAVTLAAARAANNPEDVEALNQSAPPWRSGDQWRAYQTIAGRYHQMRVTAPPAVMTVSAEYARPEEKERADAGMWFSLDTFFGTSSLGPLFDLDLFSLGPDFSVPIFIIMGEQEAIISADTARDYFESLRAPRKQFFLVPGAGHGPSAPQQALTRTLLLEEVRPLTRG